MKDEKRFAHNKANERFAINKTGAPSDLNQELNDEALDNIAGGNTLNEIPNPASPRPKPLGSRWAKRNGASRD